MSVKLSRIEKHAAVFCLLFFLAAGAASCKYLSLKGDKVGGAAPKKAPIKKIFAGAAVPAKVRSADDIALTADATDVAVAWISRSSAGSGISVAVFDPTGRKTGEALVAVESSMSVHSAGVGFDGVGNVVVSWRTAGDESLVGPDGPVDPGKLDDLYMARVGRTGELLTPATSVAKGISNFGWRGPGTGWDKILAQFNGGFRIVWYSSNDYRVDGAKLIPVYQGGKDSTVGAGRVAVAGGRGWAVYQGEPAVKYQRFTPAGLVDSHLVGIPVGTRPSSPDAGELLRHVEALAADGAGNIYSLTQAATGPGRRKNGRGVKGIVSLPVRVSLSRTDTDLRQVIDALAVADSAINLLGDDRPTPWVSVGDAQINVIWPKAKSPTDTTYWLRQYTKEGMVSGPEVEAQRGFDPGLQAAVTDKIAVARAGGADLLVEFLATGSRLYDFRITGANQGRICSYNDGLVAAWLAAGREDEEIHIGRWKIGN